MARGPATWRSASEALARRVVRRDRWGALLQPLGIALLVGGLAAAGAKAAGIQAPWPEVGLAAAGILGLVLGIARMTRVVRVTPAHAAWALDRLAGAGERGLVAATVDGPAGAEAAWAAGRVDPPRVRLLPPRGLALLLGGVLACATAVLVPPLRGPQDAPQPAVQASAPQVAAAGTEAAASADAQTAATAAAVREALGLGPQAAVDPARVAERLSDPELKAAALEAAGTGGELGSLATAGLENDALAEDVAEALAAGAEAAARARAARRSASAWRADHAIVAVPPHRRTFLERYSAAWGTPPAEDGERR